MSEQNTSENNSFFKKAERYIRENQRSLIIIGGVALTLVLGFFAYLKFYKGPKEVEAQDAMWKAQYYFEIDSFNLAINGTIDPKTGESYAGFLQIADEYSGTQAGNLANYYLGICYLNLGQYQAAIDALEQVDLSDQIIQPMAIGALGDAYMELGDIENAISNYESAAKASSNQFTSPLYLKKAALALEEIGDYKKALDHYEKILKDYEGSDEGRDIEKYIARAKGRAGITE
ncbi:MAG: tetratricopeptide repeat protein [Flavobacteriales bacterium]